LAESEANKAKTKEMVQNAKKRVKGSKKLNELEDLMTENTTLFRSESQVLNALES
jgi:hypothetical protein